MLIVLSPLKLLLRKGIRKSTIVGQTEKSKIKIKTNTENDLVEILFIKKFINGANMYKATYKITK